MDEMARATDVVARIAAASVETLSLLLTSLLAWLHHYCAAPRATACFERPALTCVLCSLRLLCAAALMSSVYEDHKDEDGFLYITYSGENTFGSSSSSLADSSGALELQAQLLQ